MPTPLPPACRRGNELAVSQGALTYFESRKGSAEVRQFLSRTLPLLLDDIADLEQIVARSPPGDEAGQRAFRRLPQQQVRLPAARLAAPCRLRRDAPGD